VVTARPSYSRIKTAMRAIADHPELELQVVVAASALLERYGRVVDVMRRDGFEPDAEVFMVLDGESPLAMAKTAGIGMLELSTAFASLSPDVVVTVADRFETMSTAVAAAYMNIPLVHIQGGEITGSIDEKVRHAITKLSDLHLVANSRAGVRVQKMGESEDSVVVTGCPSIDLIAELGADTSLDFDPFERYGGVGEIPDISDGYVVVLQHPVTTEFTEANRQIEVTLAAVAELDRPAMWFWPNIDAGSDRTSKGLRTYRELHPHSKMHFFKSMATDDFVKLMSSSLCVVGNSSAGIRECAFLGTPAVDIGSRQMGRDRGPNVIHAAHDKDDIVAAVTSQFDHGRYASDHLYGDGNAGVRIADAIAQMPLTVGKRLAYE
jgi:UDP-hydrolysing UDP-N-acetyl-D-glucosamine 2-epimerase